MDPAWVTAACALAAAVAGLLAFAGRQAWRIMSRVTRFLDDFFGEPERPGVPARPGVMARLGSVEGIQAKILGEVTLNGGGSLRDAVTKTAADVADIKAEQTRLCDRLTEGMN